MQDTAHVAGTPTAHQGGPLEDPLEQAPPRSRMRAPLGRAPPCSKGCASLERAPPRSRVHPALDPGPPHSRAHLTSAPAPVRGHLRPDTGGTAPSCARGSRPSAAAPTSQMGAHPHHCGEGLCSRTGASPVTPCTCSSTADAPSPRRGAGCTLDLLSCDSAGLGGGARPVERHPCYCCGRAAAPARTGARQAL
jgi:hypothetical protein